MHFKDIGSFIIDFMKGLGFEASKIRTCKSPENCDEALSKGSKSGGISAFFDAVPCSKIILSKYCKKYMIFGPTYRTDGFAFVFPRGDPLVADVSRAVIELTEKGKLLEIEQQWSRDPDCSTSQGSITSTSVPLKSFQGLFAVSGGISASCILISLVLYLYRNRDFLQSTSKSGAPIWSRICAVFRHYDQKDYSSYTFSKGRDSHGQISPHSEELPYFPRSQYWSTIIPVAFPETHHNTGN